MTDLPKIKDVFFIHYQCDDFEVGTRITSLGIYTNGKVIEYSQVDEIEIIEKYCNKVTKLCNQGLIPIHWNQNRPTYGIEHITERYKELTGNTIQLEYNNEIDLSMWLKNTYGHFYIKSDGLGRLDNLAILNNFSGIRATQRNERTFDTNRLLLLMKIYRSVFNNTLITDINKKSFHKIETPKNCKTKLQHPKHNPNLWNNDCFELFKYLFEFYYKSTNRQLTNIWFYLKECRGTKYNLKATKNNYKEFILDNYHIKLTNFDKAQAKWEDKERQTINDHRIDFEDSLK